MKLKTNLYVGIDASSTIPPVRNTQRGFTLLEMLVVLTILALMAAVVAPRVLKSLGGARSDTAAAQIAALSTGIDLYQLETGAVPPNLQALVEKPQGVARWNGPYLKKRNIPKDPWGREYRYQAPGKNGDYDLYTLGADGTPGGTNDDRDINNWE